MSEREWRFYVRDMIGFCEKVLAFTQTQQQAQFVADAMRFDATVRNLELIGEAASHIPQDVRNAYPTIPWRMLIATRNQLIHGYLGLDNDILWSIVQTDVPFLLHQLKFLESKQA
jgi:uncharacterized protein with HEPN domain